MPTQQKKMPPLKTADLKAVREKFHLSWGAVEAYAQDLGADESEHNQEVVSVREFFTNHH